MKFYQHHPDGFITIQNGASNYKDTVDNFIADSKSNVTTLPKGKILKYYSPGVSHYMSDGANEMILPKEWAEGDLIISLLPELLEAQRIRLNPSIPMLSNKEKKKLMIAQKTSEFNKLCETEITGGFISSALGSPHKYDSDIVDQLNFSQAYELTKITGKAEVYRVWNDDGSKSFFPHTTAQFEQAYIDGANFKRERLTKCATLKYALTQATTIEELELIKW